MEANEVFSYSPIGKMRSKAKSFRGCEKSWVGEGAERIEKSANMLYMSTIFRCVMSAHFPSVGQRCEKRVLELGCRDCLVKSKVRERETQTESAWQWMKIALIKHSRKVYTDKEVKSLLS